MNPGSPAHELVGRAEIPSSRSVARSLTRVGERGRLVLIAMAVVGIVLIAHDLSFFYDEWAFVLARPLTVDGLLAPWNGHLVATVVVVYRALGAVIGTTSYLPYLAVAWLAHAAVVGLVYAMARRHVSNAWAIGAACVMAILGAGAENILWAFQMGMMGSLAFGLAGAWVAPRRPVVAAILLTLSVATSGVGLACLAGAAVHLALVRPRALPWLAVPIAVWLAWYATYGAGSLARDPSLDGLPSFVAAGIVFAVAGILGSRELLVGAAGLLLFGVAVWRGGLRMTADLWALLAVALAFVVEAGLVRAQGGPAAAGVSRYVYILTPELLVVGVAALARWPAAARLAPALLLVTMIGSTSLLVVGHTTRLERQRCEEAFIPTAERSITRELRSHDC